MFLSLLDRDSPDVCLLILRTEKKAVVWEVHQHLKTILDVREEAGATMLRLMREIKTMFLEWFQADVLPTRTKLERSDAILAAMGVGWSPAFLSSCYPRASRHLIANFVRDIRKLSIGLVLALFVSFGHKSFVKGPVVLFTQEMTDVRSDGLLRHIVMTYGRLGDLVVLLRYLNQLQGGTRDFDAQLETSSYRKMKD